jgi:hypothetical protein
MPTSTAWVDEAGEHKTTHILESLPIARPPQENTYYTAALIGEVA